MSFTNKFFRALTLLAFAGFINSCASTGNEVCQEVDWYEIGRKDGLKGLNGNGRSPVKVQCSDSDLSLSEAFYNNGFDAGVAQSCSPAYGFELGKTNRPINASVCPPLMREPFQAAYGRGQRYSELEAISRDNRMRLGRLDQRIQDKSIDTLRRGLLKAEQLELQEKSKEIDRELASLR